MSSVPPNVIPISSDSESEDSIGSLGTTATSRRTYPGFSLCSLPMASHPDNCAGWLSEEEEEPEEAPAQEEPTVEAIAAVVEGAPAREVEPAPSAPVVEESSAPRVSPVTGTYRPHPERPFFELIPKKMVKRPKITSLVDQEGTGSSSVGAKRG